MKNVVVLGSSGSVGLQALEVIREHPDRFRVVGLCVGSDTETLAAQLREFSLDRGGVGAEAAAELAALDEADVVLNAIVGAAGLQASLAALSTGKVLALANKESLVAGGELCLAAAAAGGGRVEAVDSEHAAIAQCLAGRDLRTVERIIITASGGPFRTRTSLDDVTPDEALRHPTWTMGPKITIDSATLMNKGLEVIEAHFLFGFSYDQIDVVVHPQSVIHGIACFIDGSVLQQAGPPDMKIPIQAALSFPDRIGGAAERIDLASIGSLDFEPIDRQKFPALDLAYEVGRKAATYPAVLNAANEIAVEAFLGGRLSFTDITRVIEETLSIHEPLDATDLAAVLEADAWARSEATRLLTVAPVAGAP
ncbi:MAG: 1-deoxy-D-xylulose-5-phosphate reductoisomerase [Actinobacteria bacterium]|nr:1-deoxy-D-xylulose-5-phosphate reductoisomerase [Actinomycetota bacterium]